MTIYSQLTRENSGSVGAKPEKPMAMRVSALLRVGAKWEQSVNKVETLIQRECFSHSYLLFAVLPALSRLFWIAAHFAGILRSWFSPWRTFTRCAVDNFCPVGCLKNKHHLPHAQVVDLIEHSPKGYKVIHFVCLIRRALC